MLSTFLLLVSAPIWLLILLKVVRTAQEWRSRRAGYITFGGDDQYQAKNVDNYVHDAVMIARVQFQMSDEAFDAVIDRVQHNYLQWFDNLVARIQHKPKGGTFAEPLEIWDEYREYALSDGPLLSQIVLCKKEKIVLLVGNHVYLGGQLLSQFVQLVFCDSVRRDVFPKNAYIPVLSEVMMWAVLAQTTLRATPEPIPLFDDKSQIQRFYLKRDLAEIDAISDTLKMSRLYVIIAEHVFMVMKHMGKERIRVTLPISFSGDHSFNTVGAMFLDITATPDVPTLTRQIRAKIKRYQWQVSATNHMQRVLPLRQLSEKARSTVDLTLTVVPQKTLPDNILADEMATYEFTMDSIHYPVYIMAFIFEGQVHSSFMVNTPAFDTQTFVQTESAEPTNLTLDRHHRD